MKSFIIDNYLLFKCFLKAYKGHFYWNRLNWGMLPQKLSDL